MEGSICEAYITEETATFCSHYFESHVTSRISRVQRNDDGGDSLFPPLSIFNYPGRSAGECRSHFLNDKKLAATTTYVLLNCDEVQPHIEYVTSYSKIQFTSTSLLD